MERLQQPYAIVQMLTYSHQVGVKDGAGGGRWHDGGQTSRIFFERVPVQISGGGVWQSGC